MRGSIVRGGLLSVVLGAALCASVACGGSDDDSLFGKNSGAGGSSAGTINVGGGNGARPGSGGGASCSPGPDDQGCVGTAYEGENVPVDIYVMFDLSCSMSCPVDRRGCCRLDDDPPPPEEQWRLRPVLEAMTTFLRDPASAGIGVGLGFFGDHDRSLDDDPQICSVENHSDATVEIQRLPGAADELIAELEAALPQAGTPTHLAIDGACVYVDAWKQMNPSHKVVILLVTDGIPEAACDANIDRATAAARNCYDGGTGFETYVLGVVANNNNSLEQLNAIAEAGGTEHAYLTDTDDIAGSVLAALNAIRGDAVIPCNLRLPPPPDGQILDTNLVNLGICDSAGAAQVTPYVDTPSECDGPGWYYDDPNSPSAIQLCEATCETVSTPGASLFFTVGCQTQTTVK